MIYEDFFLFLPKKSMLCQLRFLGTGKHHPEFVLASDRGGPRFLLASVASPSPLVSANPRRTTGMFWRRCRQEV